MKVQKPRCDIAVFNYERIESFIRNFHKISNFQPETDRIIIFDCSDNFRDQLSLIRDFAEMRQLRIGHELVIVRRINRGMAEGGRLDYFDFLHKTQAESRPKYVWHIQDHYLDLNSECSRWPPHIAGGGIKSDVIPDDLVIDLKFCEAIYEEQQEVAIIYADRGKVRLFIDGNGDQWLYTAGGNFSFRTSALLEVLTMQAIARYRLVCDGTYNWACFMEMEWGRLFYLAGLRWYDLVSGRSYSSIGELRSVERAENVCLCSNGNYEGYQSIRDDYARFLNASPARVMIMKALLMFIRFYRSLRKRIHSV